MIGSLGNRLIEADNGGQPTVVRSSQQMHTSDPGVSYALDLEALIPLEFWHSVFEICFDLREGFCRSYSDVLDLKGSLGYRSLGQGISPPDRQIGKK